MWWPDISQDDAVCSERLRQVQEILSECIPATLKFEQLVIVMLKFEEVDWEKMIMTAQAQRVESLGQVVGYPDHAKSFGLPACPFSGDFAAAGTPSSATRSTLLSGGAPAPVALPLSAPITMTYPSSASVEANKQQALANRARAQAQIQEQYERDISQLG